MEGVFFQLAQNMQARTGIEIVEILSNYICYELFERKVAILSLKTHISVHIIVIPEVTDSESKHAKPLDSFFNLVTGFQRSRGCL